MKKKLQTQRYFTVLYSFLTLYLCAILVISCRAQEILPQAEPEPVAEQASAGLEKDGDLILNSYRNPALKDKTLAFFGELTGSAGIAEAVLANAAVFEVAPALAFSLCAEESAYNPRALNRNHNNTVDRGIFQLNSASFPHLKTVDFYNVEVNARYGLSHLRWCLDTAGNEVSALAMYNAGMTRVNSQGTPKHTLDYVSRILARQRRIEKLFSDEYQNFIKPEIAEEKKAPFRLSLLTPLGGR